MLPCLICRISGSGLLLPVNYVTKIHDAPVQVLIAAVSGKSFCSDKLDNDLPYNCCKRCINRLVKAFTIQKQIRNPKGWKPFCPLTENPDEGIDKCRICGTLEACEFISLDYNLNDWNMEFSCMMANFAQTDPPSQHEGCSWHICNVCAVDLNEAYGLKKQLSEAMEIFQEQIDNHPWQGMETDKRSESPHLIVDLEATLISGDLGYICSVCYLKIDISALSEKCDGCLLNFGNFSEIQRQTQLKKVRRTKWTKLLELNESKMKASAENKTQLFDEMDTVSHNSEEVSKEILVQLESAGKPQHSLTYYKDCYTHELATVYFCCICAKRFLTSASLRMHMHKSHRKKLDESITDKCHFCTAPLQNGTTSWNHVVREQTVYACKTDNCNFMALRAFDMNMHLSDGVHKGMPAEESFENVVEEYRTASTKIFKCCVTNCIDRFYRKNDLEMHYTMSHFPILPREGIWCNYCGKNFNTLEELNGHNVCITSSYACALKYCAFKTNSEEIMLAHLKENVHSSKLSGSDYDPKYFRVTGALDLYTDVVYLEGERCCGCNRFFMTQEELTQHCEDVHRSKDHAEIECKICFKQYPSMNLVEMHRSAVADRTYYYCRKCTTLKRSYRLAVEHILKTHGLDTVQPFTSNELYEVYSENRWVCCNCMNCFDDETQLNEHCQRMHTSIRVKNNELSCDLCKRSYENEEALVRHRKYFTQEQAYRCSTPYCKFKTKDLLEIQLHVSSDDLDPVHIDELQVFFAKSRRPGRARCCLRTCQQQFDSYEDLLEHAGVEHNNIQQANIITLNADAAEHFCSVCFKGFLSHGKMKRHETISHAVPCHKCGRTYLTKTLEMHLFSCSMNDINEMVCEICAKVLPNEKLLRLHQKEHSAVPVSRKPKVPCEVCGKSVVKYVMEKHMNQHMNIRQFACKLCPKSFYDPIVLRNHLTQTHSNERKFACREGCDIRYKYPGDRDRHEKIVHLGEKPWECEVCQSTFIRERDLRLHQRKHTGLRMYPCFKCNESFDAKAQLMDHVCAASVENSS
ncbi:zinc finger protein 62-like [Uranotaenia lowii]|uniref:zinc finger protein 62-like n=1 Tax=Uranotaenia lowii TaxID=190385 RepID=UPI00247B06EF|nr:zinc finger protein 62-like [Uranotaenia lowii]